MIRFAKLVLALLRSALVAVEDWKANLNPSSLEVIPDAKLEPSLGNVTPGEKFQFERIGYFSADPDSKPGSLVFNRTVGLRDSYARAAAKS